MMPNDEPTTFEINVMDTFNELEILLLRKHRDYGPRNIADAPGGAINGLRVRMHDKLARINNLIDNNKEPENESFEDSFKDLANYAIIGLLVLRGQWNND
jgi:Nucleotide modification associated domain 1